jgi:hypothetical protein
VTRDGTVGNQTAPSTGENAKNDIAMALGDWTVDYLLTPDGKFKVKMYSRTNVNPIVNNLSSQGAITTGVSLMHTQNFNEVKDLFKASRQKNKQAVPPEEEINDEGTKEDDDDG